jgi:hypothetical protein
MVGNCVLKGQNMSYPIIVEGKRNIPIEHVIREVLTKALEKPIREYAFGSPCG